MAPKYKIDLELCSGCGACPPICPQTAITEEAPFTIDPELCDACGVCPGVCSSGAISLYEWEPPGETKGQTGLGIGLGITLKDQEA